MVRHIWTPAFMLPLSIPHILFVLIKDPSSGHESMYIKSMSKLQVNQRQILFAFGSMQARVRSTVCQIRWLWMSIMLKN
jgi:hypothetical protein